MQILRQPAAELQRSPLRHRLERRLAGLHLERRDKFRQIDSLPVHRLGGGRCLLHERGILSGRTVHFRDGSRDFGNANRLLGTSYSDCDENCRNALCAGHKLVHLAAGGAGQFGPTEISTTESPISLWTSLAAAAEHWANARTSAATTAQLRPSSPRRGFDCGDLGRGIASPRPAGPMRLATEAWTDCAARSCAWRVWYCSSSPSASI
jgi:hypothetical protein